MDLLTSPTQKRSSFPSIYQHRPHFTMTGSSSAEASPSQSPSLSPSLSRRLSSRRGSVSASDPWGTHASVNMNPARSSSSRLTIVRVPQQSEAQDSRSHRRHGSNASASSTSSKGEPSRLSFAFTSFTPINRDRDGRPGSPGSSPRIRPSSPSFGSGSGPGLSRSQSIPNHTKLSPEKVVELAHSSCNPRPIGPSSSPMPGQSVPVSFSALPDDVYLPFIDRPGEVTSLVSIPPSSKLLALLSQTFPPDARASATEDTPIPSAAADAHIWTYAQLEVWLKRVKREDVDDATWVRKARHCIFPRSELIWERIKGALGIPPELDTDDSIEDPLAAYLGLPGPPSIPSRGGGLSSHMLDGDVFEPDSPAVSIGGGSLHHTDGPPSPVTSELELSIEPVIATAAPPPSAVDPTTGENMTSLHELREEDEEEEGDEEEKEKEGYGGDEGLLNAGNMNGDSAIQGLRFSTSATVPPSVLSPILPAGGGPSPGPHPHRLNDLGEQDHDGGDEHRGPLFPSDFAHLSNAPTLRGSSRSNTRLRMVGLGRPGEEEWARSFDVGNHEDAVTLCLALPGWSW
ncbi:hypothetical protein BC835DRAFT_1302777 [Cytidiella melzeri]|nr:hypothetical protein BC835DRAFT_1308987 [Cytidiella melzeri]KAI0705233.1 hypothetical protein BC835DRAFT_1302777 [Cytidiella melzeri]